MEECIETEPPKNKVYTDCSRYVQNLLDHDDDLCDVFYNNEPFTIKLLNRIFKNDTDYAVSYVFKGTKEECEKWVKEHTKTWLEDYIDRNYGNYIDRNYGNSIRLGAKIICEKILEELKDEKYLPTYEGIFNLIKDLGI